jgi:MarR family transcriptional regulator, organic hydroperoxide resistance regulator
MSDESFAEALEGFFKSMRRARAGWGVEREAGALTQAQFLLIVPLFDGQARSVRELADGAYVAAPTATRMLDGLQRDGIVSRRPAEHDRRCVMVELTDAGLEAMTAARDLLRERRAELFEPLTEREREEAERVLRRLAEVLDPKAV